MGCGEGNSRCSVKDCGQDRMRRRSPAPSGASSPFFSPDGRQLGFVKDGRTVRISPARGRLAAHAHRQRERDGRRLGRGRLHLLRGGFRDQPDLRPGGGEMEQVYKFAQECARHRVAGRAPRGEGAPVPPALEGQAAQDFEIMAMQLPHGEPHVVTRAVYARYAPSGHLVVVTSDGKLSPSPSMPGSSRSPGRRWRCTKGWSRIPSGAESRSRTTGRSSIQTRATSELARTRVGEPAGTGSRPWIRRGRLDGVVTATALSPNGEAIAVEPCGRARSRTSG